MHRCLGDVVDRLREAVGEHGRDLVMPRGFASPHAYRAYPEEVAFEPAENVTLGEMLDAAESAVGSSYEAWGFTATYKMDEYTWCWIARRGETGEGLGAHQIDTMIRLALVSRDAGLTAKGADDAD